MNIDYIINEISNHYNINLEELKLFVNKIDKDGSINNRSVYNYNLNDKNNDIILPFCGFIDNNKCFGVVYNHGLYTQCNTLTDGFCKKCKTNKKYGTIQERAKYPLGKFTPDNSRFEVPYEKFMKKMNYNLNDVMMELKKRNLSYPLISNLKKTETSRGRPKKNIINMEVEKLSGVESEEEIEVEKIEIEGVMYYKTCEDVLLDVMSHKIMGILVNEKIESINN